MACACGMWHVQRGDAAVLRHLSRADSAAPARIGSRTVEEDAAPLGAVARLEDPDVVKLLRRLAARRVPLHQPGSHVGLVRGELFRQDIVLGHEVKMMGGGVAHVSGGGVALPELRLVREHHHARQPVDLLERPQRAQAERRALHDLVDEPVHAEERPGVRGEVRLLVEAVVAKNALEHLEHRHRPSGQEGGHPYLANLGVDQVAQRADGRAGDGRKAADGAFFRDLIVPQPGWATEDDARQLVGPLIDGGRRVVHRERIGSPTAAAPDRFLSYIYSCSYCLHI